MKAYVFPGQGAQFSGMGLDLYQSSSKAKEKFQQANDILGFSISEIMFTGSAEDLKQTKMITTNTNCNIYNFHASEYNISKRQSIH